MPSSPIPGGFMKWESGAQDHAGVHVDHVGAQDMGVPMWTMRVPRTMRVPMWTMWVPMTMRVPMWTMRVPRTWGCQCGPCGCP
jgi:hypothetical protein